jgi:PilZ domain
MGILRATDGQSKDRRREPRTSVDIALMVWGVDTRGERFLQEARAKDISLSGALLSGIEANLRSGDVIGILYAGKKARYQVVWVRYDEGGDRMQVAVHRFAADECPWKALLDDGTADAAITANPSPELPR